MRCSNCLTAHSHSVQLLMTWTERHHIQPKLWGNVSYREDRCPIWILASCYLYLHVESPRIFKEHMSTTFSFINDPKDKQYTFPMSKILLQQSLPAVITLYALTSAAQYQTPVLETSCGWSTWSCRAGKLIGSGKKWRWSKKKHQKNQTPKNSLQNTHTSGSVSPHIHPQPKKPEFVNWSQNSYKNQESNGDHTLARRGETALLSKTLFACTMPNY